MKLSAVKSPSLQHKHSFLLQTNVDTNHASHFYMECVE